MCAASEGVRSERVLTGTICALIHKAPLTKLSYSPLGKKLLALGV